MDDFCAARSRTIPPLPWSNFPPPFSGWAVLEWECCLKSPQQGAAEGSEFIAGHIIEVTEKAFDDFAGGDSIDNRALLGIRDRKA